MEAKLMFLIICGSATEPKRKLSSDTSCHHTSVANGNPLLRSAAEVLNLVPWSNSRRGWHLHDPFERQLSRNANQWVTRTANGGYRPQAEVARV